MNDLIFIAVVIVFFAVTVVYVRGCERIIGEGDVVRLADADPDTDTAMEVDAA